MPKHLHDLIKKVKYRSTETHKRDYGNIFVLAGSRGLTGAAALTCMAAMRAGAGAVFLGIPESLNNIMEYKLTEVMTLPLPETSEGTLSQKAWPKIEKYLGWSDLLAIGPGLSRHPETAELVRHIAHTTEKDMILDADGLNAFQDYDYTYTLKATKGQVIVTPHVGEMVRLIKKTKKTIMENRQETAIEFAQTNNVITVLKGAHTIVASPQNKCYVNTTGNPGMATAGTGDVLTGMIAAFHGQGLSAFEAAVLGVYLHGVCGDIAAKQRGQNAVIASDLIDRINFNHF